MKLTKIYTLVFCCIGLISCNDDFFDTAPATSITDDVYWTTTDDYRLYLNQFYTMFTGHGSQWIQSPIVYGDNQSDNMVPDEINVVAAGEYVLPSEDANYLFTKIRSLNILLDKSKESSLEFNLIAPYIAEAKFFKAFRYFQKVQRFGDYQWLSTELNVDSPELYADRTPRKEVMDSILADIDYAIAYLPEGTSSTSYVNKNIALALKSRIFLYEGTYMKYHGTGDPTQFLKASYDASKELMENDNYELEADYRTLFSQREKGSSKEGILVKDYAPDLITTATQRTIELNVANTSVSKSLVDAFLDNAGKPISQSTVYDESKGWLTEFNNRDPRLSITVSSPSSDLLAGEVPPLSGSATSNVHQVTRTGYYLEKHWEENEEMYNLAQLADYDAFILRYGEILLNYAEAAYELGVLSQSDLDISINLLRDRVGMPHMVIGDMVKDTNSDFPELDVVIDEIRRERRVELALENFRYNDLMRWKAGDLLTNRLLGMKYIPEMYTEVVVGEDIVLDENGYIWPYAFDLPAGRTFEDPKHYLFPVPTDELVLNPNLSQNSGWSDE